MGGGEAKQQREYGENGNGEHISVFTLEKKKTTTVVSPSALFPTKTHRDE